MTTLDMRRLRRAWPGLALAAVLAIGCDSGSSSPTTPLRAEETGTLVLEMTDAPIDDVSELWVYVTGFDVKPLDGPLVRLEPPDVQAGLYDLLDLQNGVSTILFDGEVPADDYVFIEIELDETQSFLIETANPGVEVPLRIASQKAKLNGGPFAVRPNGSTTVLFDFDAAASLKRKPNGDYLLKPFLRVVRTSESG